MGRKDNEEKVRLLRSLAHHIHRKEPATEALAACFEAEGRNGRHRQWRQAGAVLEAEGFVPALLAAELVSPEVAVLVQVVEGARDHRLLSQALGALADHMDGEI